MESSGKTYALVTGASKGLGKALAIELASRNINLLLISMKNEGLPELCNFIRESYNVTVHSLEENFVEETSLDRILNWLKDWEIYILINNAGIGGTRNFESAGLEYLDSIIKINIRSLTLLTYLLLPKLKKNSQSFILNVASMASFSPIAYKTIYPASKAFVYNFSRCLNEEFKNTGVFVSVLNPGPMPTNQDVSSRINCQSKFVRLGVMSPEAVAKIAIKNLFEFKSVTIPGFFNQLNWLIMNLIPCKIKIPLISTRVKYELNSNETVQRIYQIEPIPTL